MKTRTKMIVAILNTMQKTTDNFLLVTSKTDLEIEGMYKNSVLNSFSPN
jgi:hypothetical protein